MHDAQRAVNVLREKIESGERGGSDEDRESLLAFSDEMKLMRETYGWYRHEKLLRHCTRMAEEVGGLTAALEDKDAARTIVAWIHDNYDLEASPETNQDYRVALKVFGRRTSEENGDEPPDSLDWIKSTLPRSFDPTPDRGDMLDWEEAVKLADHTQNPRDAALITLAYDLGARPGELYDIKIGNILDTDHGMQILVDGKRGERQPTIIPSVPYLRKWRGDPRCPDGRDDHLWSNLDASTDRVSYNRLLSIFKEAAKRAGIDKPVTPSNFRKSNAYWLALQGAPASLIEDRQGRNRGSKHVARYIARFGPENENTQYARLHGLEVEEDEADDVSPIICPRCDRETPRHEEFCVWCQQALDHGAMQEIKIEQEEKRRVMLGLIKENPDIIDKIEEYETFVEALDEDPEILQMAHEYVEATGKS